VLVKDTAQEGNSVLGAPERTVMHRTLPSPAGGCSRAIGRIWPGQPCGCRGAVRMRWRPAACSVSSGSTGQYGRSAGWQSR
jgi:hypothetical protein